MAACCLTIHVRIVGFDTTGNAGYSMPLYFKMQDADAPSVTMSYPHGRPATLHISEVDQNGAITAIEIVDGGIGYTDQYPSEIAIFSTNGSGAELSAEIDESGKITNINIDNSGLGYSVNDGISTSAPFRYNPGEPITLSALAHDPYGEFEQFHFRVNGVPITDANLTLNTLHSSYTPQNFTPHFFTVEGVNNSTNPGDWVSGWHPSWVLQHLHTGRNLRTSMVLG